MPDDCSKSMKLRVAYQASSFNPWYIYIYIYILYIYVYIYDIYIYIYIWYIYIFDIYIYIYVYIYEYSKTPCSWNDFKIGIKYPLPLFGFSYSMI